MFLSHQLISHSPVVEIPQLRTARAAAGQHRQGDGEGTSRNEQALPRQAEAHHRRHRGQTAEATAKARGILSFLLATTYDER